MTGFMDTHDVRNECSDVCVCTCTHTHVYVYMFMSSLQPCLPLTKRSYWRFLAEMLDGKIDITSICVDCNQHLIILVKTLYMYVLNKQDAPFYIASTILWVQYHKWYLSNMINYSTGLRYPYFLVSGFFSPCWGPCNPIIHFNPNWDYMRWKSHFVHEIIHQFKSLPFLFIEYMHTNVSAVSAQLCVFVVCFF